LLKQDEEVFWKKKPVLTLPPGKISLKYDPLIVPVAGLHTPAASLNVPAIGTEPLLADAVVAPMIKASEARTTKRAITKGRRILGRKSERFLDPCIVKRRYLGGRRR
jgi:hypothetical protein